MARIDPYRARRYNPSALRLNDAGVVDSVPQPPEPTGPPMQRAGFPRSPYNPIHLLAGFPEPFDAGGGKSVYALGIE